MVLFTSQINAEKRKIFCFDTDLHLVFFTGSSAQHKAEVTERTEYGGGEEKIHKSCVRSEFFWVAILKSLTNNQCSSADVRAANLAE